MARAERVQNALTTAQGILQKMDVADASPDLQILASKPSGGTALLQDIDILEFWNELSDERKFLVRYEDLVADPEKRLKEVCGFLDLEFDEKMANPYAANRGRVAQGAGDMNVNIFKKVENRKPIGAFYSVGSKCQDLAQVFGYLRCVPPAPIGKSADGSDHGASMSEPVEQRFSFDQVSDLYDRHRPHYPEALFDELTEIAGLSNESRLLEIGCGTGQSTDSFARRGFSILGLEPGPHLAEKASGNLKTFPRVSIRCETFEDWQLETGAFDLVYASQAFHWVPPELRFAKTAASLAPGGTLAVIGNVVMNDDSPLRNDINASYREHAPALADDGPPAMNWYNENGPVPELFADSGLFEDAVSLSFPWSKAHKTADYIGLMRTHSNHCLLPDPQREALLTSLADAINAHGGAYEVHYKANCHLARRRD